MRRTIEGTTEEIRAAIGALRALYEKFPTSTVALIRSMDDKERDRLFRFSKQLSDLCWQEIIRRKREVPDREWLKAMAEEEDKIAGGLTAGG